MTLNLAETSVVKSRLSVLHGAYLSVMLLMAKNDGEFFGDNDGNE